MENFYFINAITFYDDINIKGKVIHEWLEPYQRALFYGTSEFKDFKSKLAELVEQVNEEYTQSNRMEVCIHCADYNNRAIYVMDEKRADRGSCIVFIKMVDRIIGGEVNNLFSDHQLSIIRDVMAEEIDRRKDTDAGHANELLQIIDDIQEHDGYPRFGDLEVFNKNVSSIWSEIRIEEE